MAARGVVAVECRALHEPINGWVWLECPGVSGLLRDVVYSLRLGKTPVLMTPSGLLDPLRVEECLGELEKPVLRGCVELAINPRNPGALFEYAVKAVFRRNGSATVCFEEAPLDVIVKQGHVPLIWLMARPQLRAHGHAARVAAGL